MPSSIAPNQSQVRQVTPQRRLDIQGLRALAVIVVVAFHAGLPIPGGFVGVDIFFVISGYVITATLYRQWKLTHRISLRRFYWKRFLRLTPALAVMVSTTLVLTFLFLSPLGPQQQTADTGISAMLSLANIVISRATGNYFAPPAEGNPLLNTWSLSVEEQFYLFFPVILVAGWSIARYRCSRLFPLVFVLAITIGSFILAVASTQFGLPNRIDVYVVSAFYSPVDRAWEFGIGAALALALATGALKPPRFPQLLSLIGFGLILVSLWIITQTTPFPSSWTLLPTVGTALVILAGTRSNPFINRLLARSPMVTVGDLSYSIYLWHWPLIVLAVAVWPIGEYVAVVAAALSLVPAWISYRWVENPLRKLTGLSTRQKVILIFSTVLIPIVLGVFVKWGADNYWQPKYAAGKMSAVDGEVGHNAFLEYKDSNYPLCDPEEIRALALVDGGRIQCHQSIADEPVEVAIVGDSHADHLFPGLAESLPLTNFAYYTDEIPAFGLSKKMDTILNYVVENDQIEIVILSAIWHARGVPLIQLEETLNRLESAGKRVFVLDDIPDFPFEPIECKFKQAPILERSRCAWSISANNLQYGKYADSLKSVVNSSSGAQYIETNKYFCEYETCSMTSRGTLLYRDSNHLNMDGTKFLASRLLENNPDLAAALGG